MTNLHDRLTKHLQACLNTVIVPLWMTKGRTMLIMKDSKKGRVASNYRPTASLPIMWILLTGITGDEIYSHLERSSLLQNEQMGRHRGSSGTKDQLLIANTIFRNWRKAKKNLAIRWIDWKKRRTWCPILVKRNTKNNGSSRQHLLIYRSEHVQLKNSTYIKWRYIRWSLHTTQNIPRGLAVSITIHFYSHTVINDFE